MRAVRAYAAANTSKRVVVCIVIISPLAYQAISSTLCCVCFVWCVGFVCGFVCACECMN